MTPHHHPLGPPPPHNGHHVEVHYNLESAAAPAELARLLRHFADQLEAGATIRLTDDLSVALPEQIALVVRYERTPHGTLALRTGAEWRDRPDSGTSTGSLAELLG